MGSDDGTRWCGFAPSAVGRRGRRLRRRRFAALLPALVVAVTSCAGVPHVAAPPAGAPGAAAPAAPAPAPAVDGLPGMPPVLDPRNIYSATAPTMFTDAAKAAKPLVYVPHTKSGDVWVIDPARLTVVARYELGGELQHVVPSYDMKTLYATDDIRNKMTPFDPRTGEPGPNIPVQDPYNMYFTPDGRTAISVAEAQKRLVFYDPHTWQEQGDLPTPDCAGIDHADFTADGRTAVFSCEFAGRVAVVDVASRSLLRMIDMPVRNTTMGPQDVKLAPDGSVFYIADSEQNGLWVLDGAATKVASRDPHRARRARALPLPRREAAVRHEPARGQHQRARRLHRRPDHEMGDPRRQPGHGQRHRRRPAAVALGPLRPRGLRHRHHRRTPDPHVPRGAWATRAVRVAPARSLLAGAHRNHPVMRPQE